MGYREISLKDVIDRLPKSVFIIKNNDLSGAATLNDFLSETLSDMRFIIDDENQAHTHSKLSEEKSPRRASKTPQEQGDVYALIEEEDEEED